MAEKELFKSFNKQQKLCNLCVNAKVDKKKGLICGLTNTPANFYAYCPAFKVHSSRENKINAGKININTSLIFFGFVAFYVFVTLVLLKIQFSVIIAYLLVVLISYSIYIKKTPPIIAKLGKFIYSYFIIIDFTLKNKPLVSEAEINIATQQIIKLIGRKAIVYANEVFSADKDLFEKVAEYSKKLSIDERKFIFSMACQIYVYNNINDFRTSNVLKKIAQELNLQKGYVDQIKAKYLKQELIYQQRLREEKKQQKQQEKQHHQDNEQGRKIYKFVHHKYYDILGVSKKASINQIKKKFKTLALKYHPDKYVKKTEQERAIAEEKFKEITEAYNHLKKTKGF